MTTVLLIDDDPMILNTFEFGLQQIGYHVKVATDGAEGLRILKENHTVIDVIVTDIIMPRCEGLETILELKRSFSDIPVIAVSGGGSSGKMDFLSIAKELGAVDSLQKPFTIRQLQTAIVAHLQEAPEPGNNLTSDK